jgi:hypothetical protein
VDDILDRETIDTIEELHGAVMRAEAEQRFGMVRGRRPHPPVEGHAAEQAFLAMHGFASYNDFRLRIRRSTARRVGTVESSASGEDNSEDRGPGESEKEPPPPGGITPPERDSIESPSEFRRRIGSLCAAFQDDAEELIAVQIDQVERQARLTVDRASNEAAEIVGRATRAHAAVTALLDDVTRRAESLAAVTADLPRQIDDARTKGAAMLRGLGELSGRDAVSDAPRSGGAAR